MYNYSPTHTTAMTDRLTACVTAFDAVPSGGRRGMHRNGPWERVRYSLARSQRWPLHSRSVSTEFSAQRGTNRAPCCLYCHAWPKRANHRRGAHPLHPNVACIPTRLRICSVSPHSAQPLQRRARRATAPDASAPGQTHPNARCFFRFGALKWPSLAGTW